MPWARVTTSWRSALTTSRHEHVSAGRGLVKPAYKIDITPSKRAVVAGEAITFDIAAQFFDGSPVPFVELSYGGDVSPAGEQTIRTGADGKAPVAYTAVAGDPGGVRVSRSTSVPGPEEGDINGRDGLRAPATVTMDGVQVLVSTAGLASSTAPCTTSTSRRSTSSTGSTATAPTKRAGPVAGAASAHIAQISYKKTEVGETYDFITKVTRKQYNYETVDIDAGTVVASDRSRRCVRDPLSRRP